MANSHLSDGHLALELIVHLRDEPRCPPTPIVNDLWLLVAGVYINVSYCWTSLQDNYV